MAARPLLGWLLAVVIGMALGGFTGHCAVAGAGEGTHLASWLFMENPVRRDGWGSSQALAFTIPAVGRVAGEAIVTARLIRPGPWTPFAT